MPVTAECFETCASCGFRGLKPQMPHHDCLRYLHGRVKRHELVEKILVVGGFVSLGKLHEAHTIADSVFNDTP